MPNWVMNRANIVGDKNELDKFAELVKGENGDFDFQKVIPMPNDIFRGNLGLEERKKYGEKNWYDWSVTNWGTKWNACDPCLARTSIDHIACDFTTAWSFPDKVWLALSKKFPSLYFDVMYADEDLGCNCGEMEAENNDCWFYEPDEDDAYRFACEVWGFDEEEMNDGGNA